MLISSLSFSFSYVFISSLSLFLSCVHARAHTHSLYLSHTHTHTHSLSLSLSHTHTHTHTHSHTTNTCNTGDGLAQCYSLLLGSLCSSVQGYVVLLTVQLTAAHAARGISKALLQMVGPQPDPRTKPLTTALFEINTCRHGSRREAYQDCYLFLASIPTSCMIANVRLWKSANASVIVIGVSESVNECM